jgi:hypothetical protein
VQAYASNPRALPRLLSHSMRSAALCRYGLFELPVEPVDELPRNLVVVGAVEVLAEHGFAFTGRLDETEVILAEALEVLERRIVVASASAEALEAEETAAHDLAVAVVTDQDGADADASVAGEVAQDQTQAEKRREAYLEALDDGCAGR